MFKKIFGLFHNSPQEKEINIEDKKAEFMKKHPEFNEIHDNQYIAVILDNIPEITTPFDNYLDTVLQKNNIINGLLKSYNPKKDNYILKIIKYNIYKDKDGDMYTYLGKIYPSVAVSIYFPITDEWYNVSDGLTCDERRILDYCVEINNTMRILPVHHINHNNDIVQAIHAIQRIMQSRTCHRLYPELYPIKNGKVKNNG